MHDHDDPYRQADRHARRALPRGMALVVILVLFGLAFAGAFAAVRYFTADARGAVDQRERTVADGRYRIAAYESFYDQCAAVQALEDQIATMRADKSLPRDQRATNVLALTNQRNTAIREYNADARKADTQANFLASDLPYSLDTAQETTSCTA